MGNLVDQISFVKYNPGKMYTHHLCQKYQNLVLIYGGECLYGLMGKLTCDTDYKTDLMIGEIENNFLSDLWKGMPTVNCVKAMRMGRG